MVRSTEDGWMYDSSSGSMTIRPAASSFLIDRSERITKADPSAGVLLCTKTRGWPDFLSFHAPSCTPVLLRCPRDLDLSSDVAARSRGGGGQKAPATTASTVSGYPRARGRGTARKPNDLVGRADVSRSGTPLG